TPFEDPYITKLQQRFKSSLEKTSKFMIEKMDAHPVRVYSLLWRLVGAKIHYEVPLIIENSKDSTQLRDSLKKVWHSNYLKADAFYQYQQATFHISNMHHDRKEIPDKQVRNTVERLYKSMRRWPFKERKSAPDKKARREWVGFSKKEDLSVRLRPEQSNLTLYEQKLVLIGNHLNSATKNYHESMKKFDEIKK
ncbi:hypothetical protein K8R43_06785, partial [archaeon]|nr:hypothetical protein [archaeon]